MEGGKVTPEKIKLAKKAINVSPEQRDLDFERFMEKKTFLPLSNYGNKFLDYYFGPYRLDTISRKGISFYEFITDTNLLNKLKEKAWVKSFTKKEGISWYDVFRIYYGSISQFRPTTSYTFFQKYKPTSVLDFSAGWGGRMLGAIKYGCDYQGFDTNKDLRKPYREMLNYIKPTTKATITFKDSSKVDYSKYKYDMVFTSPPYYTIEKYEDMPTYTSYEDWVERFLRPVISNSYQHLQRGGVYALNVPQEIYKDVRTILGRAANTKYQLPITRRDTRSINYKEFIYVWIKRQDTKTKDGVQHD